MSRVLAIHPCRHQILFSALSALVWFRSNQMRPPPTPNLQRVNCDNRTRTLAGSASLVQLILNCNQINMFKHRLWRTQVKMRLTYLFFIFIYVYFQVNLYLWIDKNSKLMHIYHSLVGWVGFMALPRQSAAQRWTALHVHHLHALRLRPCSCAANEAQ